MGSIKSMQPAADLAHDLLGILMGIRVLARVSEPSPSCWKALCARSRHCWVRPSSLPAPPLSSILTSATAAARSSWHGTVTVASAIGYQVARKGAVSSGQCRL